VMENTAANNRPAMSDGQRNLRFIGV